MQEERVERDAWTGILNALTRLKQAQEEERTVKKSSQSPTELITEAHSF